MRPPKFAIEAGNTITSSCDLLVCNRSVIEFSASFANLGRRTYKHNDDVI